MKLLKWPDIKLNQKSRITCDHLQRNCLSIKDLEVVRGPGIGNLSSGLLGKLLCGRSKEATAQNWKCASWGVGGVAPQSGELCTVRTRFSPGRSQTRTTVTLRHGSGQNTGEDDRGYHRQVQQEPVHGGPLRTTPGEFGSAGGEVKLPTTGRGSMCAKGTRRALVALLRTFFHNNTGSSLFYTALMWI